MTPAMTRLAVELLAGLLALVIVFVIGHRGGFRAGAASVQVTLDAERIQHRDALIKAQAAATAETERRLQAGREQDHADLETAQRRADAAGATADAAQRLYHRTAAIAAACGRARDPGVASVSPAASAPGDLLADVQRRLVEAAGQLVAYGDAAGDAAGSCAARYDALTVKN